VLIYRKKTNNDTIDKDNRLASLQAIIRHHYLFPFVLSYIFFVFRFIGENSFITSTLMALVHIILIIGHILMAQKHIVCKKF